MPVLRFRRIIFPSGVVKFWSGGHVPEGAKWVGPLQGGPGENRGNPLDARSRTDRCGDAWRGLCPAVDVNRLT